MARSRGAPLRLPKGWLRPTPRPSPSQGEGSSADPSGGVGMRVGEAWPAPRGTDVLEVTLFLRYAPASSHPLQQCDCPPVGNWPSPRAEGRRPGAEVPVILAACRVDPVVPEICSCAASTFTYSPTGQAQSTRE